MKEEKNTQSKFEELVENALKRAWKIINGFEEMSDKDKNILEAYRKKAAEEYEVEDTELTLWEKESDVDTMAEIAMSWKLAADFLKADGYDYNDMERAAGIDDRDIPPYDQKLLKEGYGWREQLNKYFVEE